MRQVTGTAVLVLVAAVGCGGSKGGADAGGGAGGTSVDAAAGRGGAGGGGTGGGGTGGGGQAGTGVSCVGQGMACGNTGSFCCVPLVCAGICVQPPSTQDAGGTDAGCAGSAGFGCLFGGCPGDVGTAPVCSNGAWSCPSGATDTRTCGGCTGNPPPNYVCGDGGWFPVTDAGVGGAGGGGGRDGATDAPVSDAACGRFGQPCCANRTCTQGVCYSGGPNGDNCNA